MDAELKGCPFCGSAAKVVHSNDGDSCAVRCVRWASNSCLGASSWRDSTQDAIAAWNHRHSGGDGEDSARLDWLLANCATMDTNGFGDWRVAYEYTSPVSYGPYADGPRAAIDSAMQQGGGGG